MQLLKHCILSGIQIIHYTPKLRVHMNKKFVYSVLHLLGYQFGPKSPRRMGVFRPLFVSIAVASQHSGPGDHRCLHSVGCTGVRVLVTFVCLFGGVVTSLVWNSYFT